MGKPEAYVENYLRKQAKTRGWLCYKFVSPTCNGVPDDIVIGNGMTVFVECKSKNGRLSALQRKTITAMQNRGAFVYVAYTREHVDKLFEVIENAETVKASSSSGTREKIT